MRWRTVLGNALITHTSGICFVAFRTQWTAPSPNRFVKTTLADAAIGSAVRTIHAAELTGNLVMDNWLGGG